MQAKPANARSSTASEQKSSSETDTVGSEMTNGMRRVDWRWAVAKGFLNKETNEWNEEVGGKEAYLKQRNERMNARKVPHLPYYAKFD